MATQTEIVDQEKNKDKLIKFQDILSDEELVLYLNTAEK